MRPTFSVIVPALNEEQVLPGLLQSLQGEPAPKELILADGGSDDRTVELALAAGARIVRSDAGRGEQLARGAAVASADVLLFLHADTRVGPGALAALGRAYGDPRVVASGMSQRIGHPARVYRAIEGAANLRVRCGRVYGDSGLAVRRPVYEAAGGFRALPLFEDLDLSRRLRRLGRIVFVRDAELWVSPRRWEAEGAVRRTVRNWLLTLAWSCGVDPSRLVRYYPPHSAMSEHP